MRLIAVVGLCLLAITSITSGAYGELGANTNVSFGLPFSCATKESESRCLADEFQSGLNVVLMNETEMCKAKTGFPFTAEHAGASIEATLLEGTEKCLVPETERLDPWRFQVAVVGVDPAAVRLISPQNDRSSVPKDIELEARRLLKDWITSASKSYERNVDTDQNSLSDSPPEVLKARDATLLIFHLGSTKSGPIVLLLNNKFFRLEGWCTGPKVFLSVTGKLHLAYFQGCCGCGESVLRVYELSGAAPKLVYENGALSN